MDRGDYGGVFAADGVLRDASALGWHVEEVCSFQDPVGSCHAISIHDERIESGLSEAIVRGVGLFADGVKAPM